MNMRLGSILFLTILIYVVETSAYASRLAGIRTRRPSQANSFYNLLALSARAAKALQTTLLAGLVDRAVTAGLVTDVTTTLRLVLLAAAGGIIIGAALVPSIARLLERAVQSYEQRRSLPRVVLHGLSIETLPRARRDLRPPRARAVLWASRHSTPLVVRRRKSPALSHQREHAPRSHCPLSSPASVPCCWCCWSTR
jgi:hypothetical protein